MASATTDAARIAAARRWFRLLGHAPTRDGGATIVATPAYPDTWSANFALADSDADPATVLAALDRQFARGGWQTLIADALTAPGIEAALALADYACRVETIEMLARGPIAAPQSLPAIATRAVRSGDDWASFDALVAVDHAEGRRTGAIDAPVAAGLLAAMHARPAPCDYRLILVDGAAVGYGLTVACPGGLGLIEELFTLPDHRGRGIMSAFIAAAVEWLREGGCDAVFLDAHSADTPKRLYHRLGFAPVALSRTWVRQRELA